MGFDTRNIDAPYLFEICANMGTLLSALLLIGQKLLVRCRYCSLTQILEAERAIAAFARALHSTR